MKDSLQVRETGPSIAAHEHDGFDPDWAVEIFTAFLECGNKVCGELVAVSGRTHQVEVYDEEQDRLVYISYFEPQSFYNAPPVFPIYEVCPAKVANELRKAFALIWADKGSCANRLRSAVEALLTDQGIAKTTITKKKKRVNLTTQSRIDKFAIKNKDAAGHLTAIKWQGNAGSHANENELSVDELLDGFELFEHALDMVYDKRGKRLKKIARKITKRKGRPVKKRRSTF